MPGERSARTSSALWPIRRGTAIATAEIASELRRGADYVRVTIALTVLSTDVAGALSIAWDAFRGAARDDLAGWEVAAAAAGPAAGTGAGLEERVEAACYRTQIWSSSGP